MAKVVTERPRYGHEAPSRKFGRTLSKDEIGREREDDSARAGFVAWSRSRNDDPKTLSDLLGPLRKSLRRQVGRPWNAVWSELCENLDHRTVAGLHIFDHVRQEVSIDTHVDEDGEILAPSRWSKDHQPVDGLYVHPRTGLLCFASRRYDPMRWEAAFRAALRTFGIRADGPSKRLLKYRIDGLRVWEKQDDTWILHIYKEVRGRRGRRPSRILVQSKQASRKEIEDAGSAFLAAPPF